VSDAAGNSSSSSSLTITVDTTAPAAPVVSLVSDTGSNTTDKITSNGALNVSQESGALVQYRANDASEWTTVPARVEGANSLQVRQIDAAGNASDVTSFSFTLDTIADAGDAAAVELTLNTVEQANRDTVPFSITGLDADRLRRLRV
jgi:hypothetical protein